MSDKKSNFLITFMVGVIFVSILLTYYKTMVERDFIIIDDLEEESIED